MTENGSSPVTAFKDLAYLISQGRITVLKDKPNSQTHYLVVNDNNEFNILEREINCLHDFPSIPRNFDKIQDYVNSPW